MKLLIVLLAITLQVACSSKGFNRRDMRSHLGVATADVGEIQAASSSKAKPKLPQRFQLAVYFVEPTDLIVNQWSSQDKAIILSIESELKKLRVASKVFEVSVPSVQAPVPLKTIRLAAAKSGADAVLVVYSAAEINTFSNNWTITYLALLPMLFVPGTNYEGLFIGNAVLWDTQAEHLYLTAEAEAEYYNSHILAFHVSNKKTIAKKLKQQGLVGLRKKIIDRVQVEKLK